MKNANDTSASATCSPPITVAAPSASPETQSSGLAPSDAIERLESIAGEYRDNVAVLTEKHTAIARMLNAERAKLEALDEALLALTQHPKAASVAAEPPEGSTQ